MAVKEFFNPGIFVVPALRLVEGMRFLGIDHRFECLARFLKLRDALARLDLEVHKIPANIRLMASQEDLLREGEHPYLCLTAENTLIRPWPSCPA